MEKQRQQHAKDAAERHSNKKNMIQGAEAEKQLALGKQRDQDLRLERQQMEVDALRAQVRRLASLHHLVVLPELP